MRILLDECVDRRLALEISRHEVVTVTQAGWSGTKNGELLALAARDFDVFLTVDRNLAFQQNITSVDIAVVILRARTSRIVDLRRLVPRLHDALNEAQPGKVILVE